MEYKIPGPGDHALTWDRVYTDISSICVFRRELIQFALKEKEEKPGYSRTSFPASEEAT